MATISNYNKHLKLSERIKIENFLNNNVSFRTISKDINKGVATISREIKNRRYKEKGNYFNEIPTKCSKIEKAPFVCNGCNKVKQCRANKYFYSAELANEDYLKILKESREGIDKTTVEFKELNKIVKKEIDQGHSFALIVNNNPELNVSERTLYNYQEKGYLDIINFNLPRKIRYKKRKRQSNNSLSIKKENQCRIGRTYQDFLIYIKENNIIYYTEMDTVEGIIGIGQSCLLTLYLKQAQFLFIFKISEQNIISVNSKIKQIKLTIGNEMFHKIFNIILTDNGSEFKRPNEIEDNGKHVINSKVFYCDAQRSDQKSQIELSHEYIRRFIPKGVSINNYSEDDILNMMCHINSTPRKSLNWKCPYDVAVEMFGKEPFDKLGIYKINSKDVILNKKLFNKTNDN